MKAIKKNSHKAESSIKKAPKKVVLDFLIDAYNANQIVFTRSLTYQRKHAPMGFIFYRIKYATPTALVYDGAWQMDLAVERKLLLTPGQLQHYLIQKLAGNNRIII